MKYRIWSDEKKIWVSHTAIATPDGTVLSLSCEYDDVAKTTVWRIHNLAPLKPVVELCTGLLDKNKTEIYEGDILKKYYDPNIIPYDTREYPQEPKFNYYQIYFCSEDSRCQWRMKYRGLAGNPQDVPWAGNASDYEIVGNIHENPELVK